MNQEYQPPAPQNVLLILFMTIIGIIVMNVLPFASENIFLLAGELFIILPALFYIWRIKHPFIKAFRIKPISLKKCCASVILFMPVYIITDEIDRLVLFFFPIPDELAGAIRDMVTFTSVSHALFLILTGVLIAAIVEEMLFRGLFQQSLEYFRDPAIAIVLASVLFAILHFNPWTSLQILLLGLLLGYITWQTGSIFPAVILHALNNAVSITFINLSPEQMSWYIRNGHVHWPWLLFAIVFIIPAFRYFLKK